MLRLKIEVGLLTAFLVGYLYLVVILSTHECFEPEPSWSDPVCDVDYPADKMLRVLMFKSP
jgi:hypothetical protein